MRPLVLAVCAAVLAAPLAAQSGQRFTDPDFDLSITVPAAMRELSFEERAATLGFDATPELARNVPRAEAARGEWMHNHIWVDQGLAERFIHMTIFDHLPFSSPQEFIEAMGQITPVLENGTVEPEQGGPAVWVERRFDGSGGVGRRLRVYYYVDPGNQRSMSVKLQAREDAWDKVEPDMLAMLDTLDWDRLPADVPPTAGAMPGMLGSGAPAGARRGGKGGPAAVAALPSLAGPDDYASWASREVLGSMILAGLLLLGLLFGGRGG